MHPIAIMNVLPHLWLYRFAIYTVLRLAHETKQKLARTIPFKRFTGNSVAVSV